MENLDFQMRTRLVAGAGAIDRLGKLAAECGGSRVLIVTDPGIVEVGHVARGTASLQRSGLEFDVFDGAAENPTTEHVQAGAERAARYQPDLIVGLGGGSSMDCAKGINFIYTNGGRMQDYWGVGLARHPMLPMVAVPTTSGTGSEMQSFALISDAETHAKMACGDKKASFRVAILDPMLTVTQPPLVTAVTGIDAISHAVETYVSTRRNPVSRMFSREAWRLLANHFQRVIRDPQDLAAREAMQLGAALAGLAIENSMLGAAHSLANPVTARYGTIHGQAVGITLPHVIRYNGEEFDAWYRDLLLASGETGVTPPPESGAAGLADFILELVRGAGLADRFSACGVAADALPQMAQEAAGQWTAQFNPRAVDSQSLESLYQAAL